MNKVNMMRWGNSLCANFHCSSSVSGYYCTYRVQLFLSHLYHFTHPTNRTHFSASLPPLSLQKPQGGQWSHLTSSTLSLNLWVPPHDTTKLILLLDSHSTLSSSPWDEMIPSHPFQTRPSSQLLCIRDCCGLCQWSAPTRHLNFYLGHTGLTYCSPWCLN